jgi:hypothetical protein
MDFDEPYQPTYEPDVDTCYQFRPQDAFVAGPCFFVGSTGRGKTNTLINMIAWHGIKFGTFAAFCGSASAAITLGKSLPDSFIHYPYDDLAKRKLRKLIDAQQRDMYSHDPQPLVLIFDDMMYEGHAFVNSKEFRWLIFNSRAGNVWACFTMQYCKHIPPEIRSQGFYAFLCSAIDRETRGMLAETFAPIGGNGFRSAQHFYRVFDQMTQDFGVLVVDRSNLGPHGDHHPTYYWFKPIEYKGRVPLGGDIWNYHDYNYDDRWYDRPGVFNQMSKQDQDKDKLTAVQKAIDKLKLLRKQTVAKNKMSTKSVAAEVRKQLAEHKAIEKPHALNVAQYSRARAKKLCLPF